MPIVINRRTERERERKDNKKDLFVNSPVPPSGDSSEIECRSLERDKKLGYASKALGLFSKCIREYILLENVLFNSEEPLLILLEM